VCRLINDGKSVATKEVFEKVVGVIKAIDNPLNKDCCNYELRISFKNIEHLVSILNELLEKESK
jgi:hypothetical protein